MSNGEKRRGLWIDPRTKILLLLLCVLSATMAPSLLYEMLVVALVACFGTACGKIRYSIIGIIVYGVFYLLTQAVLQMPSGNVQVMLIASRTLCGLHKEASGQFLWNEKPQDRKERLHRSYMVMQDVNFELFADSVEAECSFGIRNPDKSLIETTMDSLGLLPYRTHHPNTLSGGQKQRVAVAVSMICGKELLVFDEPTSGLDFDSMEQVALLIQKLSAMGKVIFVVTNDYEFVCRTCSRVLHIDHGEQCDDFPLVPDNEENLKKLFSI